MGLLVTESPVPPGSHWGLWDFSPRGGGEGQFQHQVLLPGVTEKDEPQVAVVLNALLLARLCQ